VFHHSQFIEQLLRDGRLRVEGGSFKGKRIVFHDPCYLGRANGEYEAPRTLLAQLDAEIHEMKRSKKNGLCCGAGGAQIFKEPEAGTAEVHHVRAEEAIATGADIIAVGCPFCKLMLTDGVTHHGKEGQVQVLDIAEAIATANDL
jgi:Fe-S oxidoreductase